MRVSLLLLLAIAAATHARCPADRPWSACSQCFTDDAEARKSGCNWPGGLEPPAVEKNTTLDFNPFQTTLVQIGQTWMTEFQDYTRVFGPPAGSSHYGEIYTGRVNQGTDGQGDTPFMAYVAQNYPGSVLMMAISIKDNPGAGGYPGGFDSVPDAVRDIAAGRWDAQLLELGRKFAQFPQLTILVRLGYEVSVFMMKGDTNSYHQCYNRMARILRQVTPANNVRFVYHPVRGFPDAVGMYPGDENVDYIAFSAFNHDLSMATDEANPDVRNIGLDGSRLDQNLRQSLDWASQRKPVIIAESAYQQVPAGWINRIPSPRFQDPFLEYMQRLIDVVVQYNMPVLTYIDSNWPIWGWTPPWTDSRVEVHIQQFWQQNIINNPRFVLYQGGKGLNKTL